ncbi:DUF1697 domain-containing protein [Lacinutrix sp. Bg11-31]|uniref:DUF1697 domain-containing protein n=1 Tax=Lacinutrix sp. Bg11-31 TaxID=2057808 RepID=UPI000C3032F6|nr:DUF1697 domain-containing protein [Lacinutrix sp. Bg11-31]AUC82522.1 hypothetical protein CW733_10445 [Lacinutrix sp. Bg11-31]
MKTYIALIRGINVGGHKKVPMAILRDVLSKAGFNEVKTYIQSGNVVFQASEKKNKDIEKIIQQTIESHFGFNVPILVKTKEELQLIFDSCVFSEEKKKKSYFILLDQIPDVKLVKEAHTIALENEEFSIVNNCIYFYSSTGYGRTKFNMNSFEKKLIINATSRNYNTINKLLELA